MFPELEAKSKQKTEIEAQLSDYERYDEILADKEFSRIIEIIEEYDDILFDKEKDYE